MKAAATFIAVAFVASAVACGPKQPDYDNMAKTALSRAGLENLSTNYDNDAKVVHITGTVMNQADRERAQEVVKDAVAPGAQVANEVTVEGRNAETADDLDSGLSTRLDNLIQNDTALSKADVDFDVKNGVVTITGQVATAEQKDRVAEMARNQPGVRQVVNSLEVRPRS